VGEIVQSGGQRESTRGRRGSPFLVMERRPFEVKSPKDWPIRTPFPALIAKLNSVSEGENKCSISSLERICVPDDASALTDARSR
jgi:hypothetical protein